MASASQIKFNVADRGSKTRRIPFITNRISIHRFLRLYFIQFNRPTDDLLKIIAFGCPDDQNLCVRAARLLQKESGYPHGVEIEIEKQLPMGAGLGGGSSDAATTLLALNELWNLHLSYDEIIRFGLSLGADVPVFVSGRAAWAEGVGDILTPLEVPEPWYVVLKPECHVSTSNIFASPGLTRNNDPVTLDKFISGWTENDCLQVVAEIYPQVSAALDDLSRFGRARLTGTGACVFAAFDSESRAKQVAASLAGRWHAFISKGLNLSPLRERLSTAL